MLARTELIDLIKKIKEFNYSSEQDADTDLEKFNDNVMDPASIDYIFDKEYEHLTAEEIVEKNS